MSIPTPKPGDTWSDRVAEELGLNEPRTTMPAIRLPDDLREKIEQAAAARGMSRSEFVRQALARAVEDDDLA